MAKRPRISRAEFEAGCLGKRGYTFRSDAVTSQQRLWERKTVIGTIYRCRVCHQWHIGALNRRNRLDMRLQIIRLSRFRFPVD